MSIVRTASVALITGYLLVGTPALASASTFYAIITSTSYVIVQLAIEGSTPGKLVGVTVLPQ